MLKKSGFKLKKLSNGRVALYIDATQKEMFLMRHVLEWRNLSNGRVALYTDKNTLEHILLRNALELNKFYIQCDADRQFINERLKLTKAIESALKDL